MNKYTSRYTIYLNVRKKITRTSQGEQFIKKISQAASWPHSSSEELFLHTLKAEEKLEESSSWWGVTENETSHFQFFSQ